MKLLHLFFLLPFIALLSCSTDSKNSTDLYSAVPKESVLILETSNIEESLKELSATSIFRTADSLPPVLNFHNHIKSLSSGFEKDSLSEFLKKKAVLMTVTLSGAEKYNSLFITAGNEKFEKEIGKKLSAIYKVSQKNYSDAIIFHFFKEDNSRHYYVCSNNGLLLFSTSSFLVEEAIRQMGSEYSIRQNLQFEKLYKTSNKKDLANLYINLQELPGFLKSVLPLGDHQFVERFGSWAELDIQVNDKEVIMSGLTLFPDEQAYFLQTFNGIRPQKTRAQEIIPLSSGLWVSHTFANAEQYYRNYLTYLEKAGRLRKHEQLLEKLGKNPERHLLSWVDSEMGIFTGTGEGSTIRSLAYFLSRDQEKASSLLDSISQPDFIEGYRGVIIKKLKAENALSRFYGSLFADFHFPYYTLLNDFVVFSEDLGALKGVINDQLDGKTLSSDEAFMDFTANIPSESHIKVLASSPGFFNYLAKTLEGTNAGILENQQEQLSNYRWAALQINVDDNAALTNFYLLQTAKRKERISRQWNVQLQSEAANTPQFLKNYVNNKYDIAIQDKDHRLYLIDYTGKILWTKNLDGPLMGNITQVDLYKNNKLQMVLNTRESLYVIDRLGRDVENFPVKLKSAATAPVGVFNYDQARNYRFVMPCGRKLLNYDLSGKEVKGWDFKDAGSEIISKPQHFTVNRKDVIVILTEEGKLLQLNRRGEKRFETIDKLPKLQIPFYLKAGESLTKSQLLANSSDGKLYAIFPGGSADALYLDSDHPADYMVYFDEKYIFSHDNVLLVKSSEKPWMAELDGDISTAPKAMILGGEFYAGAYSSSAEEIRLFNKQGQLIEGFPVYAQGPFDMGSLKQDGAINIVTYTSDGMLICYRLN